MERATVLQLRPNRTKNERLEWAKARPVWASPSGWAKETGSDAETERATAKDSVKVMETGSATDLAAEKEKVMVKETGLDAGSAMGSGLASAMGTDSDAGLATGLAEAKATESDAG